MRSWRSQEGLYFGSHVRIGRYRWSRFLWSARLVSLSMVPISFDNGFVSRSVFDWLMKSFSDDKNIAPFQISVWTLNMFNLFYDDCEKWMRIKRLIYLWINYTYSGIYVYLRLFNVVKVRINQQLGQYLRHAVRYVMRTEYHSHPDRWKPSKRVHSWFNHLLQEFISSVVVTIAVSLVWDSHTFVIIYIVPMCKVYQGSGWGFSHENDHQYACCNDTGVVYVLHILLVRAVRDIQFRHAISLLHSPAYLLTAYFVYRHRHRVQENPSNRRIWKF